MDGWNTTFLLGRPIFRGYVSLPEGKFWCEKITEGYFTKNKLQELPKKKTMGIFFFAAEEPLIACRPSSPSQSKISKRWERFTGSHKPLEGSPGLHGSQPFKGPMKSMGRSNQVLYGWRAQFGSIWMIFTSPCEFRGCTGAPPFYRYKSWGYRSPLQSNLYRMEVHRFFLTPFSL